MSTLVHGIEATISIDGVPATDTLSAVLALHIVFPIESFAVADIEPAPLPEPGHWLIPVPDLVWESAVNEGIWVAEASAGPDLAIQPGVTARISIEA